MTEARITRRVAVTTNVRFAPPTKPSAYLRVLDLETGDVLLTTNVPESSFREYDPNPRGGQRGGRGLSVHGGRLVVANAERLFVLDTSWRLVGELTHPLAADIHDVLAEEDGVWVACTASDALLQLDWDGSTRRIWSYRNDRGLIRRLGLARRALPRFRADFDYRDPRYRVDDFNTVHLNSVVRDGDRLLVMFGRMRGVTQATWDEAATVILSVKEGTGQRRSTKAEILCRRNGIVIPNHNVARAGDLVVFNDSNSGRIVAWEAETNVERHSVVIPGDPPFTRGLARVDSDRWLVGAQGPLAIYVADLPRGEVVAEYVFDGDQDECVYAICPLPDEFEDPPRLEDSGSLSFWKRATLPSGVTPIPVVAAGTPCAEANG